MIIMVRQKTCLFSLLLGFVLSACSPGMITVTPPLVQPSLISSSTPRPDPTPPPQITSTQTGTPTIPLPPSVTPTKSVTPTQAPDFSGFQVQFVEYKDFGMVIGFIIPGVTTPYKLTVNKQIYSCLIKPGIANHLYCSGVIIPEGTKVRLEFFEIGDETEIFQTNYIVSLPKTPTPDYFKLTKPDCPVRGINARCETENRIAENGSCIVSTCVDSCGYWYSIDTCYYSTPFLAPIDQTRAAQTATAKASP